MPSVSHQKSRYDQLLERASAFVAGNGGAVHEDLLIRHVFGSSGSPDLWRSLLRQILEESEQLGLRGDGYWMLGDGDTTAESPYSLLSEQFTVIDVETTGLKPYQHRVIEFGAVRYQDGVESGRLSLLVQPERTVPRYVSKLTGIDDSLLSDAPRFSDVVDQILEFIEDSTLVGYNVNFDVSFLNAELERCGRPTMLNHAVDLLPVAGGLMPGTRARGLASVAKELGVAPTGAHRALDDALTTAGVLFRLAPRIRTAGMTSLAELDGFRPARRDQPDRSGPLSRGRSLLDPQHVESAPSAPGVYIMRGDGDRVLYVGKAKDLRARIRSYYSQPLGYTRKMDGLLQSIQHIETLETGSELAALLLEAQLIARYRPQFNRQMRTSDNYPYIRIETNNPWPRVNLVKETADDGARYYGPYRSSRAARATVDALNDIFPLRSCSRSFKDARSYGSPCTDLDFGRCLGPCTGQADREAYQGYVREIIAFLDGDVDPVIARLHQKLEEAAAKLDFEKAARVRSRIERVSDLAQSQSILSEATNTGDLAVVLPGVETGSREIMLTRHGRTWSRRTFHLEEPSHETAIDLNRSWSRARELASPVILQRELDSVQILVRWVRKNWDHPSIIPLTEEYPDWDDLIEHARTVDLIV
ncbi:MAG: exonuclease domain-containing protein [Thermomicrobiaceae bacterium]